MRLMKYQYEICDKEVHRPDLVLIIVYSIDFTDCSSIPGLNLFTF